MDAEEYIKKRILKYLAMDKYGELLGGIVKRRKMGIPEAARSHLARLEKLCDSVLPDDYRKRQRDGALVWARHRPSDLRSVQRNLHQE